MSQNTNVQRPTSNIRIFLQLFGILASGLFIYGLWLGNSPLDRTEPFRALVAHQMVNGGSWLVPRLYGELYLRKPPLIYWIEASTELLLHHGNEFIWRLPSAIGSALLAVFVAWWAARWFGLRALLPAGFACLALIAVWDQDRSADIDALNTAFAVVTSATVLELLYGNGRKTFIWSIAFGLSLGATLLLKGPGGLPQILAAMIGAALLLRDWKPLGRRMIPILAGALIGSAIFAAYIVAAKAEMRHLHIVPDPTGWFEVIEKIFFHGWISRLTAIGIAFKLVAYALPVSLVLPFSIWAIRRLPTGDLHRQRAMAILGTLAAASVIWILGGIDNPRYEYVMLPLLAPLVGFVWTAENHNDRWFKTALLIVCFVFCIANLVLTAKLGGSTLNTGIKISCAICVAASVSLMVRMIIVRTRPDLLRPLLPRTAGILLLLFAVPMAARKNLERQHKSAKTPAEQLRSIIGSATRVSASGVVRDLPELFYYANVEVDAYGEFGLPQLLQHRGHWIVVSQGEKYPAYSTILKYIPNAFPRGVTKLNMPDPRDQIYVGWYDPPAGADTRIEWNVGKQVEPDD
jgi:4-amino-4-deoxy-L-arabinose transferase-like glycosyltransferase